MSKQAERLDARWWRVYNDAIRDGAAYEDAVVDADRECAEQFGGRA